MGPNVKKLIIYKVSRNAIPDGGGVADGLAFLSSKSQITDGFANANKWVNEVINIVRLAAEPNPWKDADDESIAGEILRRIQEKKMRDSNNKGG